MEQRLANHLQHLLGLARLYRPRVRYFEARVRVVALMVVPLLGRGFAVGGVAVRPAIP